MSKISKQWVDATIISEDQVGVANGVASLDGTGRIPSAQLPTSAQEYKGAWDADTNSPALADGIGTNGDMYRVSVAGTQDLGSGSQDFLVGDQVIYNGSIWQRTPENTSLQGKTTDDLAEGSTNFYYTGARFDASLAAKSTTDVAEGSNLYFNEQRVQDTIISDYSTPVNAPVANTDDIPQALEKLQGQINNIPTGVTPKEEVVTLSALDISNGYYDLLQAPDGSVVNVTPDNGPKQTPLADYSVSTNRVTFLGDLASTLVDGSIVVFTYSA